MRADSLQCTCCVGAASCLLGCADVHCTAHVALALRALHLHAANLLRVTAVQHYFTLLAALHAHSACTGTRCCSHCTGHAADETLHCDTHSALLLHCAPHFFCCFFYLFFLFFLQQHTSACCTTHAVRRAPPTAAAHCHAVHTLLSCAAAYACAAYTHCCCSLTNDVHNTLACCSC